MTTTSSAHIPSGITAEPASRDLPPAPAGWYVLAFSRDLRAGAVRPVRLAGRDLVLARLRSGDVMAALAHCPHLGAHLGHGGTVEGDALRCPMHGLTFNAAGTCTSSRTPARMTLTMIPVVEQHGVILGWHHWADADPLWRVRELDMTGWTPWRTHALSLRGHPQETSENSVDLGHFGHVHGYRDVHMLKRCTVNGHQLRTAYRVRRALTLFPRGLCLEFNTVVEGLGHSTVHVRLPAGLQLRLLVLATPLDDHRIKLRLALSARVGTQRLPSALRRLIGELVARASLRFFVRDVRQDVPIWRHKAYMRGPILIEGDGPIGPYRRWARQFYRP
ncbi:Rieske 2Fe-2S domain-containing protein [Nonomuraea sp. NPDC049784]|uniref:aromatic ring-hydroxylating oxygenase subunit alpha n=1 Tax=Nonomuraea sp. NPDC049784 TaxID=3154361 RepID=UPI0033DF1D92